MIIHKIPLILYNVKYGIFFIILINLIWQILSCKFLYICWFLNLFLLNPRYNDFDKFFLKQSQITRYEIDLAILVQIG